MLSKILESKCFPLCISKRIMAVKQLDRSQKIRMKAFSQRLESENALSSSIFAKFVAN